MNKYEEVSSLGYQMSLAGRAGLPGGGGGVPVQLGPMFWGALVEGQDWGRGGEVHVQ